MKKKNRGVWAFLGLATAALLVATFALPAITQAVVKDKPPVIKHVVPGTFPLPLGFPITLSSFSVRVSCDENFQVKAVYAKIEGGSDVNVIWTGVLVRGTGFAGGGLEDWLIGGVPFDPAAGSDSLDPIELLSTLLVGPAAIPAGGTLIFFGELQDFPPSQPPFLRGGAVVETAQGASCSVIITG